ncbi:CPBP family intramembrane glutamic endopeptidase [Parvimonas sp. C2]|uniref:CPBP family intramembrane glutamic endopeptidase n=1 Tax=Parvimonas sp. C2 TaxID=3110692 RepID=UPI002B460D4E|nr:type II CAAX endopeptidase family protein [Parvimonas sp. C2]MEB3072686.1 type II CAAX endopeptidase family protein [Parvimonas sp. C2]
MGNIKNSKKWVAPILMFIFCEFIFRQRISKKIFYDDLLVFAFFDNTVVNKYFSLGLWCFVVACIILLISKFVFNGKMNSIDNSEKMDLKKSIIISILFFVFTMILVYTTKYIEYYIFNISNISLNTKNILAIEKLNFSVSIFSSICISIFEEMVYRRILFGYLYDLHSGCNKYIRIITSIVVSSIIFGSIHDGVFAYAMVRYIIYGISFSAVYLYTKRIGASIAVHVLINIFLIVKDTFL